MPERETGMPIIPVLTSDLLELDSEPVAQALTGCRLSPAPPDQSMSYYLNTNGKYTRYVSAFPLQNPPPRE
jgi:hypothetical protein